MRLACSFNRPCVCRSVIKIVIVPIWVYPSYRTVPSKHIIRLESFCLCIHTHPPPQPTIILPELSSIRVPRTTYLIVTFLTLEPESIPIRTWSLIRSTQHHPRVVPLGIAKTTKSKICGFRKHTLPAGRHGKRIVVKTVISGIKNQFPKIGKQAFLGIEIIKLLKPMD